MLRSWQAWFATILITSLSFVSTTATEVATYRATPVVLVGEQLEAEGIAPDRLVAFAYRGAWVQIPLQIDERDLVEFAKIYGYPTGELAPRAGFGHGVFEEVYCDAETFTGSDSNPLVDANDEIVFMLEDAGAHASSAAFPVGVRSDLAFQIEITGSEGSPASYVYLFVHDGSLDQSAGRSYVHYDFDLQSGDYKQTYNTIGVDEETGERNDDHGPQLNPEDSWIRSDVYSRHWSYRWTCDALVLFGGDDLVEREDYWIAPGSCGRHNGTFNAQEGAFIANIDGPVRAIRSFLGANSGPLVQMDRIYYQAREDLTIHLRVHPRPAVGIFYVDHTMNALGMTYSNDLNLAGVVIDGQPDRLHDGHIAWELVAAEVGSVLRIHSLDTDIPLPEGALSVFYEDSLDTTLSQCCVGDCGNEDSQWDARMIGASGIWNQAPLPNTDPALLASQYLSTETVILYGQERWTSEDAARLHAQVDRALQLRIDPYFSSDDS